MFKFKFPPPDHNSIYEICYSTSSDTTSGHEHGPGPGVSPNLRFEFPASWPGPNWAGTPRLELVSRERASRPLEVLRQRRGGRLIGVEHNRRLEACDTAMTSRALQKVPRLPL